MQIEMLVPTQTYGNIKFIGKEKDLPDMERLQRKYAERPMKWQEGEYKEVVTFTGDTVLYNEVTHSYTTLDHQPLMGGSTYAKQFESPFDSHKISEEYALKHDMAQEDVLEIWEVNGKLSRSLGTVLHLAMENYFRHRHQPAYNLPKNPYLNKAVETNLLSAVIEEYVPNLHPETMVANLKRGHVGQIDLFVEIGEKSGYLIDWKTDVNIKKNLKKHYNQLSFYAHCLIDAGYEITHVEVHNFVDAWTIYKSDVLPLK